MLIRKIIVTFFCTIAHAAASAEDEVIEGSENEVEVVEGSSLAENAENNNLRSRQLADWCDSFDIDPIDYSGEDGGYYVDMTWDCKIGKHYKFCFKEDGAFWPVCQYQSPTEGFTKTIGWSDRDSNGKCSFRELVNYGNDWRFTECQTTYKMKVWERTQFWPRSCTKTFTTGTCGCANPCPYGGVKSGNFCYFPNPPGKAFVWQNKRYHKANYQNPTCPTQAVDGIDSTLVDNGTKCLIWTLDSNYNPWMWPNNKGNWYYSDIVTGVCPYQPFPESGYDGANCKVAKIPSGYVGIVEGQSYYTHPKDICPLAGSFYDGANCFVANIPSGLQVGVTSGDDNTWYYRACP